MCSSLYRANIGHYKIKYLEGFFYALIGYKLLQINFKLECIGEV